MSEVVETTEIANSPLQSVHQQLDATMVEQDGWSVPQSYGDVLQEYWSVRDAGAGLIDLSSRGRLLVSGSEAVVFLNGLITNDMKTLRENSWMPAAFPNVQGRLLASVRVVRLGDEVTAKGAGPRFLIDTEARSHESVLQNIQRFTFAGDFHVSDITSQTAQLSLQGSDALRILTEVLSNDVAGLPGFGAASIRDEMFGDLTIFRATHTGEDGFDLVVSNENAAGLWKTLQHAGARPVGHDALEMLRIEAGIPRYGIDMDESNVVTETALDEAVSYTKGCYVGQEIIARIKYRGHVAKRLSGLICEQTTELHSGDVIFSADDKEIGRLTSVTHSPKLNQTIALGYLKYDYLAAGTAVKIVSGSEPFPALVTELPLVKRNS